MWRAKRINKFIQCLFVCLLLSGTAAAKDSTKPHRFLPDHVKLQYAGTIGYFSIGAGYQNRKEKLEGDLYYGYVPKSVGGVHIHALSGKLTWYPLKKIDLKSFQVKPLSVGTLVSYTFGKQYFLFSPENYPYSYYNFPTALHIGAFIGGQVDKTFKNKKRIGLYYELGTTDRELSSYVVNRKSIKPSDILNLAVGIKTSF